MKNIKVYLQYPWKISDSQYYKSIINNPPKGIEFISKKIKKGMIINRKKFLINKFLKQTCRLMIAKTKLPIVNAKLTPEGEKYDLLHCAHCLSKNKKVPWVADFEALWQMWISGEDTKFGRKRVLKLLKRNNCKKIIAWTEEAKKEITKKFPEIKNKVEVVYYGQEFKEFEKKNNKKITLLFLARYFYAKGGLHAIEAIDRLTKKYKNVEGKIISQIPPEIIKKYGKNKNIKFSGLIPHEEIVKRILPNSDILIYPGYTDTFGFALSEALAFGIPIITVEGFARKEIVRENEEGFIVQLPKKINESCSLNLENIGKNEEQIITNIVEKTSKIIEDKKTLKKMSLNGKKSAKTGRFSVEKRNKKLKKIYVDALENI